MIKETTIGGFKAVVWEPATPSTHVEIFCHGRGGTPTEQGPFPHIKSGVYVPKVLVVACQAVTDWPRVDYLEKIITDLIAKYGVKSIALTGLSAGAAAIYWYMESGKKRDMIKSIVAMSMDKGDDPWTIAHYKNILFWAINGNKDTRYTVTMKKFVADLNAAGGTAKYSEYAGAHNNWHLPYNPNWVGGNIYTFLDSAAVVPPPVKPPVAPTITLGAVNTILIFPYPLSLDAEVSGGVVKWEQVSGPAAPISDGKAMAPSIGKYEFKITATEGGLSTSKILTYIIS